MYSYLIKINFKKRRDQKGRIFNILGETANENKMPEGSRGDPGLPGFQLCCLKINAFWGAEGVYQL